MWMNWRAGIREVKVRGKELREYKKKKDFLVCVDSDGCAMDTMNVKHFHCFGPCMVKEWGLERWRDEILERWNEINLFTITRGINRFKGLAKALREIQEKYTEIPDLPALEQWVQAAPELSNAALGHAIRERDSLCLRKALAWSDAVNQAVENLPGEEIHPFRGVREALAEAHKQADVAVVSSANREAVLNEWEKYGLLEYTDIVMAQDSGSKASCIQELLGRGYEADHVLMCGDAAGDLEAAEQNGVYFYPVLVRHEEQSWKAFVTEGLPLLLAGTFGDGYQQEQKERFLENLNGGKSW